MNNIVEFEYVYFKLTGSCMVVFNNIVKSKTISMIHDFVKTHVCLTNLKLIKFKHQAPVSQSFLNEDFPEFLELNLTNFKS